MIKLCVWEYIYPCSSSRGSATPAAPPPPHHNYLPEGPRWCSDPKEDTCKSEPVGFRVNIVHVIKDFKFFSNVVYKLSLHNEEKKSEQVVRNNSKNSLKMKMLIS